MQRAMIFGLPGSGKSHFALELSAIFKLPLYHLDQYFFVQNWVERDPEEFLSIQKSLVEEPAWIIDGNAIRSLEIRFSRADTAIYFHFNRLVCLWRIFKRLFWKHPHIQDRAQGCGEKVSWKLIRYMWTFHRRVTPVIKELRQKYPDVAFYTFYRDQDLSAFVMLKR